MSISMEEVHILTQESALDEMRSREVRLQRDWARIREELAALQEDIEQKRCDISRARNEFLRRCVIQDNARLTGATPSGVASELKR